MPLLSAPIPSEIMPWVRGIASVYLESHARLPEALHDHVGTALVNFHVHIMAPSRSDHPFLGVDRFKIAAALSNAAPEDSAAWEGSLETADALWKKGFCAHLSEVADAMFRSGENLIASGVEPVWVEDLISRGLKSAAGPASDDVGPKGVAAAGILFLERSLRHAVSKGDVGESLGVIKRIHDLNPPGTTALLRRIASEFLSEKRVRLASAPSKRSAVSLAGQKALITLAKRGDPECLKLLSALANGDAVLFGDSPNGGKILSPHSGPVLRSIAEAVVAGDFGLEGQHLFETYLKDQNFVLPYDATSESLLRAIFYFRSGYLLLKLLAKNASLDAALDREEFSRTSLYFTPFHLNLLEPLARKGRSDALRFVLRRNDLADGIRRSPPSGRDRAVQSLIAVYHQAPTQADRDAVADLMEATEHESAVAFFRGEVARLAHVHSFRDFLRTVWRGEIDVREKFQRRIERMVVRGDSRSA